MFFVSFCIFVFYRSWRERQFLSEKMQSLEVKIELDQISGSTQVIVF
jgi:hypothetical protein